MIQDWMDMLAHSPLIYLAVGVYLIQWVLNHPAEWQAFLSSLDTNGGHLIACIAILIIGYRMFQSDQTAGGQLITGAETALFVLLNAKRPTRVGDPPPESTTLTQTTTSQSTAVTEGT